MTEAPTPEPAAPEATEPPAPPAGTPAPDVPAPAAEAAGNAGEPDPDHAPAAKEMQDVIVGDSGLYEQQPTGDVGAADLVHRTSAPPAAFQSGVPLAEDRAAGVVPNEAMRGPAPVSPEAGPDNDASGGQTSTPGRVG